MRIFKAQNVHFGTVGHYGFRIHLKKIHIFPFDYAIFLKEFSGLYSYKEYPSSPPTLVNRQIVTKVYLNIYRVPHVSHIFCGTTLF